MKVAAASRPLPSSISIHGDKCPSQPPFWRSSSQRGGSDFLAAAAFSSINPRCRLRTCHSEAPRRGPRPYPATTKAQVLPGGGVLDEGELLIPAEEAAAAVQGEHERGYDWREEWYPLYLTAEVPHDAPLGLTVFHKKLVLYRDGAGAFHYYEDRCAHMYTHTPFLRLRLSLCSLLRSHELRGCGLRLAKLSEGQLIDGRLECLYHGWQFEG